MEEAEQPRQSNGLLIGIIVLVAVLVLAGVGYSMYQKNGMNTMDDSSMEQMESTPATTTDVTPVDTTGAMTDEVTITVNGSNFKFEPTQIKVKKGQKVKVVFNNTGGSHDFVIDEFNVRTKVIQGDSSETVEFTPDKTGSFEFYCSVGTHRQMGMKGTLIVE